MPDKEFDKLFRDKFADAEMEPSAQLWANIEQQLAPKQKRRLPVYWMAAASVVLAISAMLMFQKKEVIWMQGPATASVPVVPEPEAPVSVPDVMSAATPERPSQPARKLLAVQQEQPVEIKTTIPEAGLQPNTVSDRLPIKQQDPRPVDVMPVKENPVTAQVMMAQADVADPLAENQVNEAGTERKSIRNVGDLVNFVVDKVDKREKKLVRFNTDDDDNSSIIGINIGFLKLNKKDR